MGRHCLAAAAADLAVVGLVWLVHWEPWPLHLGPVWQHLEQQVWLLVGQVWLLPGRQAWQHLEQVPWLGLALGALPGLDLGLEAWPGLVLALGLWPGPELGLLVLVEPELGLVLWPPLDLDLALAWRLLERGRQPLLAVGHLPLVWRLLVAEVAWPPGLVVAVLVWGRQLLLLRVGQRPWVVQQVEQPLVALAAAAAVEGVVFAVVVVGVWQCFVD